MQLYFIRHGQSVNNAGWGYPHYREHHDPPLTELGIEQAQILAGFLGQNQQLTKSDGWNEQNRHGFGVTHIYASLMERAAHTGSYIAQALQIPFEAWDIHESGGIFDRDGNKDKTQLPGRPRSFFEINFPGFGLPEVLDESGWWNRPFETEEECGKRAKRIWSDLLTRHGDRGSRPEERIAFVSHGGFFVHLMSAILDMPWKNASHGLKSWFLLNNCSISRIDIRNDHVIICYLNRTDHLRDHMIT